MTLLQAIGACGGNALHDACFRHTEVRDGYP